MTIEQILATRDLEKSVLVGYYGGGNYGDELLLEVLANRLKSQGVQHAVITYQKPKMYRRYHHDFGYPLVDMNNKAQLLRAVAQNRNIIVGGGGLWGLDVNPNIVLLSLLLLASKWVLRKKVWLLGVGYYNSTTWYGRLGAWLAGKSAEHIVARDSETLHNFRKVTKRVSMDMDIAWSIPKIDLQTYRRDFIQLNANLPIARRTVFITLRRFKPGQSGNYNELIEKYVANSQHPVIVAIMEPHNVDPEGHALIRSWQKKYRHVRVTDFSWNPLALFLFFQEHRDRLAFIGPQFHMIITAYLNGVPFLPIAYDNKVSELFKQTGEPAAIDLQALTYEDIQTFTGSFYKETK